MRKIAVFTSTRADYGILYWILKGLQQAPDVELQLLVGGMHLSAEFGNTAQHIETDGFHITECLDFLQHSDTPQAISKSMAQALSCTADVLAKHQPELLVVLGDRFETMAIAQAAMIARIPIAHIHGGELSEGANDDAMRHCITKMAQLHFAAAEPYRQRIIQLGEQPNRVFNYGAPGLDNITKLSLMNLTELSQSLSFKLDSPFFLLTYHPVTLESDSGEQASLNLLNALDQFPDHQIIATYPNADSGGRVLIKHLQAYQARQTQRVYLTPSLGQLRYLSCMQHCAAVIGNSSSGLIEAPAFNVPTVNIGQRQLGRLQAQTVINSDGSSGAIIQAIQQAISAPFIEQCKMAVNPYGNGHVSAKIVEKLKSCQLHELVLKRFYDMPVIH